MVSRFLQDYRVEKTIMSLYALSALTSKVIRESKIITIKAEMLVVSDIVQLAVGDVVPADLRLCLPANPRRPPKIHSLHLLKNPYH